MGVLRAAQGCVVPLLALSGVSASRATYSTVHELDREAAHFTPVGEPPAARVAPVRKVKIPVSSDCSAKRDVPGADVILLMGQSNMSGRGDGYDEELDRPNNPRVQQWSRDNQIILASEHLEHSDFSIINEEKVGMGTTFGRAYVDTLPEQRDVLLVPTAYGGTGLVDGPWFPGGHLFEDAVARLKDALAGAEDEGNCVAGVLWHQGEQDAGRHVDKETYMSAWTEMIGALRMRVPAAAQAPVVLGEFSPAWIEKHEEIAAPVLAAIRAIPESVPFTAVAPSDGLSNNAGGGPDAIVHFDAVSQREYGMRYFDKLGNAIGNDRIAAT